MASGTGSQIAIIRVGSLTLPNTTVMVGSFGGGWRWTNFVSESIEHTIEELEEGALTGNRDTPPSHQGASFGQGDVNFEPNPNAIGSWLYAATGVLSSQLVVDAGSTGGNSGNFAGQAGFTHYFVPRQTEHDESSFNEPHAVLVHKDVGSAWLFNAGPITALSFNFTAGQLGTSRATLMSKAVGLMGRTSFVTSLVSSGGRPWIWDSVSVEIGPNSGNLAAISDFESMELDLTVPHEGIVALNGEKGYAKFPSSDFRRLAVNGTLCFQTNSEYEQFVNYEPRHLRITARQSASSSQLIGNPSSAFYPTIQIDVPAFKMTSFSAPVGGPNRLVASFRGKGERADAYGLMVEYLLTNVTSGY